MLLAFSVLALWIFYAAGGFSKIIKAANMEPEPTPEPMQPEPVTVEPQPQPTPEPMPEPKQEPTPEPEKVDRVKLERIAQNCLNACGVSFDTYYYVRNKSDIELMDIITRYNLDN